MYLFGLDKEQHKLQRDNMKKLPSEQLVFASSGSLSDKLVSGDWRASTVKR